MTSCAFCDIIEGKAWAGRLYADDRSIAFLDHQPINPGHLLVVPRDHAAKLADLEPETGGHMFRVGMKLAGALRRSGVRCEGVDLFLADGKAAGQEVMHVHLHVIPRYWGDGFGFRFAPDSHTLSPRAELAEVAEQIRSALEE